MSCPLKQRTLFKPMRFLLLVIAISLLVASAAGLPSLASNPVDKISYISFDEAKSVLEALRENLPPELKAASKIDLSVWRAWVGRRDAEIRARLIQGDEDSLVNFLLFGTSYTAKPRVTLEMLVQAGLKENSPEAPALLGAIEARASDLIAGMLKPGGNERLLFARRLLETKGYDLKTEAERDRAKNYLLANLARVLTEQSGYAKALDSARLLGNPSQEFAERSKLYSSRGLSSDTSLMPNLGVEESLKAMKASGLIAPGSVRRVAIVGPGLDFTDKQDGYDFYPQQTIQPFAIADTLLKLGLGSSDLRVTTLDLSPRVNDHLTRAIQKARRGAEYVIQLPLDAQVRWTPEALNYWETFGSKIGAPVTPVGMPAGIRNVKVRAVRARADIASRINVEDVNIVLQRIEPPGDAFDLVVATNILVYYEIFEQSLALVNIEHMTKVGGFLLSNNAVLELPGSRMRSVGYKTTAYSDRSTDGDHVVWYRRSGS